MLLLKIKSTFTLYIISSPYFRCICESGYQLDNTGKKCVDVDECENPNVCTHGGICRNFPGSFQCICPQGSLFNPISNLCEDENECEGE